MATTLILTSELADVQPASGTYYRLKLQTAPGERSANPSLVRAVTNTVAGPSANGVQITLNAADAAPLAWITDPLAAGNSTIGNITAAKWLFHIWAMESDVLANVAMRYQLFPYTNAIGASLLDDNGGSEVPTAAQDMARTSSGNASATTINDHDRLVLKVLLSDAGTMAAGYTATVAFNGQYPRAEGDSWIYSATDTLSLASATRPDDIAEVRELLKDTGPRPVVTDIEITDAIEAATQTYSRDHPRLVAESYSPDGNTYDFPMPRRWIHGFSQIREIEYPNAQQFRVVLLTKEWEIIEDMLGTQPRRYFRLNWTTPASGTTNLTVRYTTRHERNTEYSTVPVSDVPALLWLATAYTADMIAARAAALGQAVPVPGGGGGSGEPNWAAVAKFYRDRYKAHIFAKDETGPASVLGDWDTMGSLRQDRIFHGRRIR